MSKTRIYELARDLDLESKEVLTRAQELGLEVKTASSGLDEDEAELVRLSYQDDSAAETPPAEDDDAGADDASAPEEAEESAAEAEDADVDEEPAVDEDRSASGGLEPLDVPYGVTVADLATLMRRPTGALVKAIMAMGEMAAAAQPVPEHILHPLTEAFGFLITVGEPEVEEEAEVVSLRALVHEDDAPEDLELRPPVITVMGHVDHGKTQLLDTIRHANVVAGEAGGITQHIGAYQVTTDAGKLTFIDTPGHEAFTSLRARGANVTDIVILVVAANDGVMPQTAEAISHAKAAGVPMIVAVNKMDLPEADPYAVRAQLTEHEIVVEELGGDVVNAEVSALTGEGVDGLLELVQLTAELEDLKSNPTANPEGVVIESNLDKGRGPVATVIVQRGTLRVGDVLVAGAVAGRVRAMIDDTGSQVKEAGPSTPVLIMGWSDVPSAGDRFQVAPDDKTARNIAADALAELRAKNLVVPTPQERMTTLLEEMRTADDAELRLIIKTDVTGSLEAIRDKVSEIGREGGKLTIVSSAVGGITESDVILADASKAVIFGFNVRPDSKSRKAAENAGVDIRTYRIIYELLDEVEQLLVGQLAPDEVEDLLGVAEVRATFRAPRLGTIAGSYVTEGEISRGARIRLVRDGVVVYDGRVASLRRFKDDARSVAAGFECGIGLENFRDIKEGDVLESYQLREVARV
ncbi:MAG: translation initiation factor IF-2 [Acidimicrobiia bacterium]|nr:translation initiation factor IF-2 [Acidimicrobiia bacterium]NNF87098.1 translation initiation factor IF-2 [Acidimicrobiia bacterium]NNL13534.1 translation initiation factor IF-2 [Acidimicrobiia bacterium]